MKKMKKGFTIVELVIVIGVIGILSAILIPTFVNLTANAQATKLQSDLANTYSMYAAEAADGVIDGSDPEVKIVLSGQEDVKLVKGTDTYMYDGGWKAGEPTLKTDYTWTLVADTAAASTFNEFVIWYQKAPTL